MSWDSFVWFALAASVFWICGAVVSLWSDRLVWFDKLTNQSDHSDTTAPQIQKTDAANANQTNESQLIAVPPY